MYSQKTSRSTINVPAIIASIVAAIAVVIAIVVCARPVEGTMSANETPATETPVVESAEPSVEPTVEPTTAPVAPKAVSKNTKNAQLKAVYNEEPSVAATELVVTENVNLEKATLEDLTQGDVDNLTATETLEVMQNTAAEGINFEVAPAVESEKLEQGIEEKQEERVENVVLSTTPDVGTKKAIAHETTSTAPIAKRAETKAETVVVREDNTVSVIEKAPSTTKTDVQVVDTKSLTVETEVEVEGEGQVESNLGDSIIIAETTDNGTEYHGIVIEEEVVETPAPVVENVEDGTFTLSFGF